MIQLFEIIGFSFILCFIIKAVFSKPKLSSPQETLGKSLTKTVDMDNVAKDNNILGGDDKSADLLHSDGDKNWPSWLEKKVNILSAVIIVFVLLWLLLPRALPIALVLLFLGGFFFLIGSFVGFILDGLKEILKKSLPIILMLSLCAGYLKVLSGLLQGMYMDIIYVYLIGFCESHKIYNFLVGVVNFFASLGFKSKSCDFNVTILVLLAKLALIAFLTYLLQRCYKWIFSEKIIDE